MKNLFVTIFLLLAGVTAVSAQEPDTPEQRAKKTREWIEKQTEQLSRSLKLEYWQEFYVDSILTANIGGLQAELEDLQAAKVGNPDIYQEVSDRWNEATYQAYQKVFDEEQWKKWLKSGGAKDKKARDKRAAKKQ